VPGDIAMLVAAATSRILGLTGPDAVDPHRPFSEQGMDSLMATELAAALGEALGCRLPGTLVYNHPTPAALVGHLTDKPRIAGPTLQVADTAADGDLLSQLETRLSDIDLLLEQTS